MPTGSFGPADPMPDWLLPLRKTAGICAPCPAELVQALVIRYDPGAGTGSHRDRPVFEYVISVSLGAPATMRFRRRPGSFDRASGLLAPRSIYHLAWRLDTNESIAQSR
jgi:DNA oxidative demethylase